MMKSCGANGKNRRATVTDGAPQSGQIVAHLRRFDHVRYAFPHQTHRHAASGLRSRGHLAPKPKTATFVVAAALPQSGFTAWHALFVHGQPKAGRTVLFNGAASGVGHPTVQSARRKGARVIGSASVRNEAYLRSPGGDAFVDYAAGLPAEFARSADLVLDAAGGDGDGLLDALKPGGRLVPITWGRYSAEKAAKASVAVREGQFPPSLLPTLAGSAAPRLNLRFVIFRIAEMKMSRD